MITVMQNSTAKMDFQKDLVARKPNITINILTIIASSLLSPPPPFAKAIYKFTCKINEALCLQTSFLDLFIMIKIIFGNYVMNKYYTP